MTVGLSLYAFGVGVTNAGLYRLALFSSNMSKGTVSAVASIVSMMIFVFGIELASVAYVEGGASMFNIFNLISGLIWLALVVIFLRGRQTKLPPNSAV
jgi:DHA1 family multidrug/chloramphenicol efflux transport protein-like MFS transporter